MSETRCPKCGSTDGVHVPIDPPPAAVTLAPAECAALARLVEATVMLRTENYVGADVPFGSITSVMAGRLRAIIDAHDALPDALRARLAQGGA